MRIVVGRISKLEKRFGVVGGDPQLLVVLRPSGQELALHPDRCIQILGETGYLPIGPVGLLNFLKIPADLSVVQTEIFLREDAAELCCSHRLGYR